MENLLPEASECLAFSGLSAAPGGFSSQHPTDHTSAPLSLTARPHHDDGQPPGPAWLWRRALQKTYQSLCVLFADHRNVTLSTLYAYARELESIKTKAQRQQFLWLFEESALVNYILEMPELGTPITNKYLPSIALSITRHRLEADRSAKEPKKNWHKVFERRH